MGFSFKVFEHSAHERVGPAQHSDFVTIMDRVRPLFKLVELAVDYGETANFGIQMMLGLVLELLSSA